MRWLLLWPLAGALMFLSIGGLKKYRWHHLVLCLLIGPIMFAIGFVKAWKQARKELREEAEKDDRRKNL